MRTNNKNSISVAVDTILLWRLKCTWFSLFHVSCYSISKIFFFQFYVMKRTGRWWLEVGQVRKKELQNIAKTVDVRMARQKMMILCSFHSLFFQYKIYDCKATLTYIKKIYISKRMHNTYLWSNIFSTSLHKCTSKQVLKARPDIHQLFPSDNSFLGDLCLQRIEERQRRKTQFKGFNLCINLCEFCRYFKWEKLNR